MLVTADDVQWNDIILFNYKDTFFFCEEWLLQSKTEPPLLKWTRSSWDTRHNQSVKEGHKVSSKEFPVILKSSTRNTWAENSGVLPAFVLAALLGASVPAFIAQAKKHRYCPLAGCFSRSGAQQATEYTVYSQSVACSPSHLSTVWPKTQGK